MQLLTQDLPPSSRNVARNVAWVGFWMTAIALSAIYCEAYRLAHGAQAIQLRDSMVWMIEIWSGWLVLSFPARAWVERQRGCGVAMTWRWIANFLNVLCLAALSWEWLLNLGLAWLGLIERFESPWDLIHRRGLFCIVVSAALLTFLARRPTHVASRTDAAERATLSVPTRAGVVTIPLQEIEAILGAENYVRICTIGGKEYLHRATLSGMQELLGADRLLRVHRSALVNVEHLGTRLPDWQMRLPSGRTIRVGRAFRAALSERPCD